MLTFSLGEGFVKWPLPGCFHYEGGVGSPRPPALLSLSDAGKRLGVDRFVLVPLTASSRTGVQMCVDEIGLGFQVPSSTRRGEIEGFFICLSGRPGSWSSVV